MRHANRPVAAIPRWHAFNECIAIDIMILPDLKKDNFCVLVIVDMASDFTIAELIGAVKKPTAADVRSAFDRG